MTTKKTSFGPTVITCRGAGSAGHDFAQVGAGKDVGLDVQVPTAQTANAIQVTKPDGSVIWAIGPGGTAVAPPSVNVATFAAFAGAGLTLVSFGGKWQVSAQAGITFS